MPRVSARKRPRAPVSVPSKPHAQLVSETYERLGVTPEAVAILPRITHILTDLPKGVNQAIEFLRGSSEPDARKWLAIYDEIPPTYRSLVPVEAYCLAANLTTKRLLELVTGACFEQSDAAAHLIAKASKPEIIKATVACALYPGKDGAQDRKMMHLHEGFVPVPKTSVVNVHGNVTQDNRIQSVSIGELAGIEQQMSRIANRFNERMIGKSNIVEVEHADTPELDSGDTDNSGVGGGGGGRLEEGEGEVVAGGSDNVIPVNVVTSEDSSEWEL